VHALKEAGVEVQDQRDYPRDPDPEVLLAALKAHGFVAAEDVQAGDVLLFRFARAPQHVGLAISDTRMIHAYAPLKKVVSVEIGANWQRRLCGIYRLAA
jgi:cell wall-associated NlpC family hydrolase